MKAFDKDIRGKLYNHIEEYDSASFSAIKSAITPPKKDNRRGIIFFFGSMLLIFLSLQMAFDLKSSIFDNDNDPSINRNKNVRTNVIVDKDAIANEVAIAATTDRTKELLNNKLMDQRSSSLAINNKPASKTIVGVKGSNFISQMNVSSNGKLSLSLNKIDIAAIDHEKDLMQSKNSFREKSLDDSELVKDIIIVDQKPLEGSINNISTKESGSETIIVDQSNISSNNNPINENVLANDIIADIITTTDNKSDVLRSKNVFEFSTGPNLNQTKLSSLGEEMSVYQLARQSSERHQASYSIAAYAGIRLRNNVVIKTGISFTNLKDQFTYNDPAKETTKLIRSVKYLYGSGNRLRDSIVFTETISTPGGQLIHTNNYNYIDIPLIAEVSLFQRNKFGVSWNPGVFVNATFSPDGYIYDEDAKSLISLANDDVYKNRIGFSFYNSVSFKYKLSQGLELNLEPGFRFSPLKSTTDQAAINEVLRTSQFNLSIRYHY